MRENMICTKWTKCIFQTFQVCVAEAFVCELDMDTKHFNAVVEAFIDFR